MHRKSLATPQKSNLPSSSCTISQPSLRMLKVDSSCKPATETYNSGNSVPEIGSHADLGVLAYARKPVHREKPNERFLLGTIRSVAFGELVQLNCYHDQPSGNANSTADMPSAVLQQTEKLKRMKCGISGNTGSQQAEMRDGMEVCSFVTLLDISQLYLGKAYHVGMCVPL